MEQTDFRVAGEAVTSRIPHNALNSPSFTVQLLVMLLVEFEPYQLQVKG